MHWQDSLGQVFFRRPACYYGGQLRELPEPDLREFRPLLCKGILFDEASCRMVLQQKKLFQAPPSPVRLGCSTTTNSHAYDVFISGVALMIASSTWLADLAALKRKEDAQWLINNSIVVHVGSQPLWLAR